ncbi:enoyl-CoA hydratase protein [Candidatus Micropelagos thuwalensis]|uniref:Dual-specificity RNA methyltransferase RlmN n=1 Tax=Candidatus Micropelagius thuwalensis TaxID=1397666 RepID=U2XMY2_9PROT|nr:23S rRNA (adenine(2503)-C(2))-methyltransferase RlmN [Candidatus Micropelagos thuwalensis]ERL46487.1 enoyl-CoA hydratase protein [Candidatus Micropelagos thuwalensis]
MSPLSAQPPTSLVGLNRTALKQVLANIGVADKEQNMRVRQIWSWLYVQGVQDIDKMTTLSGALRNKLAERHTLKRLYVSEKQVSEDGTRKYLFKLHDGHEIETVYIPETGRGTLCISSQVGCTLNCTFCHTGTMRLVRNLEPHEIVSQLVAVRDDLDDWQNNEAKRAVSNIVMMGMGEPLYNTDHVINALNVMSDGDGTALSKRRITLSTSGVVPEIARVGDATGVMLAISLHAVRDDLRNELVPLNKKYPIEELLDACRAYPGLSNARRITFEYVMLKDVNDSDADAHELVRLLSGIPAKINLIPFNPWPGSPYECSSRNRIMKFADIVNHAGYASPVRTPRGRDIMAACGQLKSASEKMSAADRKQAELAAQRLNRPVN